MDNKKVLEISKKIMVANGCINSNAPLTTGFHLGIPGSGRAYHPWDNLQKCKCGGYPYMVSRNNECYKSDEPNRIYCRQCRKTTSFGTVTEIRKEWTEINRGDR